MIELAQGDILKADAEALVNTVNCVGVSGRGVALQFRKAFPENFKKYAAACDRGEVQPGRMFVFETGTLTNPRYIINFPTKRHWRGKSRLQDIEEGLDALVREVRVRKIRSIAIPPLGSGLGGLKWSSVKTRIKTALSKINDVTATVFEPLDSPPDISRLIAVPKMTGGRAALVVLINRYLAALMEPFITLLEVHKLMYFMQETGHPLRLRFSKALYGPYAENLRHQLSSIEGHLVAGYFDGGDEPEKQLELLPGAVHEATDFLDQHGTTRARFDRVVELVQGFETPFGLELLASVHWVATRENASTEEAATKRLYAWNQRKRRFSPRQIRLAWGTLGEKGWLP